MCVYIKKIRFAFKSSGHIRILCNNINIVRGTRRHHVVFWFSFVCVFSTTQNEDVGLSFNYCCVYRVARSRKIDRSVKINFYIILFRYFFLPFNTTRRLCRTNSVNVVVFGHVLEIFIKINRTLLLPVNSFIVSILYSQRYQHCSATSHSIWWLQNSKFENGFRL